MKNKFVPGVNIVEKSYELNKARLDMSLLEYRFFNLYLSRINARDVNTRYVKISLEDYCKIMNIRKINLESVRTTRDNLLRKLIHIPNESGGERTFQIFSMCDIRKENGVTVIEFNAHDQALPFMFNIQKYLQYPDEMIKLPSFNSMRLYECCVQYKKIGYVKLTITELKERLNLNKKAYERWADFKTKVIDVSVDLINALTNIFLEYKCGEKAENGKSWKSIIFIIKPNPNYKPAKLDLENIIDIQPKSIVTILANTVFTSFTIKQVDTLFNNIKKYLDNKDKNDIHSDVEKNVILAGLCKHIYDELMEKFESEEYVLKNENNLYGYVKTTIKQKVSSEYNSYGLIPTYWFEYTSKDDKDDFAIALIEYLNSENNEPSDK